MLTAKVVIRGTRPLLWHHFGPETISLERKEKTGVAGKDPEEWRKTHLATEEGQLYLQRTSIFGCLRDGARHTRKRQGSIQRLVASTLEVLDDRVLVDRFMPKGDPPYDPTAPVYIDVQSVKNPGTKMRNVRYRVAASSGWRAQFSIAWDETIVSQNEMRAVAIDAGRLEGLGDGRAIGFGRFEVGKFTVAKPKAARRRKRA
jgi:hypothetical protein